MYSSQSHSFNFLRSFSGCRDLTLYVLRQAKTSTTIDQVEVKIRSGNEADSWSFLHSFLPFVIKGLKRHELIEYVEDTKNGTFRTTHLGQAALNKPSDFVHLFKDEFEEVYHALQIEVLRAERGS